MKLALTSLFAAALAMPVATSGVPAYAAAPPAPIVRVATQTTGYTVSWNNVRGETGYEVALWVPGGNTMKATKKVSKDVTSYFWKAGPGQVMCFQVRSLSSGGASAWSPVLPLCGATQPGMRFPWPKATKFTIGPLNLHADNLGAIVDDSDPNRTYDFSHATEPYKTALDIVLYPSSGNVPQPSKISATTIAWGTVLAVSARCRAALIDHSKVPGLSSWAMYLHLTEITVHAGQTVEAGFPIGKVRTDEKGVTNDCGVVSDAHHVHLALIEPWTSTPGPGLEGVYQSLEGQFFCRNNQVVKDASSKVTLTNLTAGPNGEYSAPC